MRLLFKIDSKDYNENGTVFVRPSSRCLAIKNGKIAMVHSIKYNYYKFPGGGIENAETREAALIRETLEEAGLVIIPESIKEFGYVHRVEKLDNLDADYFVQDNFYFLCDVEENLKSQNLDDYESDEKFTLEWIEPEKAISINRNIEHGNKNQNMIEREAKVLEILIKEGYFD